MNRYTVISPLGEGGMAEVFLARDEEMKKEVVIKRLRRNVAQESEITAALREEAALTRGLRHPNIVELFDIAEENGRTFLVMEYVAGHDLYSLMQRARQEETFVPVGVALRITVDVAAALDYAHRAADASGRALGLMHRDVTPSNVLLAKDGTAKLADFGIAKAQNLASVRRPTSTNTVKGTLSYLAPEQVLRWPVDQRIDIYGAGVLLWELLAARPLYRGKTEFATLEAIAQGKHEALENWRKVSPRLRALTELATAHKPEHRFLSAADLLHAIDKSGEVGAREDVKNFVTKIMG